MSRRLSALSYEEIEQLPETKLSSAVTTLAYHVEDRNTKNAFERRRVAAAVGVVMEHAEELQDMVSMANWWLREERDWMRLQTIVTVTDAYTRRLWETPEKLYVAGFLRAPFSYNEVYEITMSDTEEGKYIVEVDPVEGMGFVMEGDDELLHGVISKDDIAANLAEENYRLKHELTELKRLIGLLHNQVKAMFPGVESESDEPV